MWITLLHQSSLAAQTLSKKIKILSFSSNWIRNPSVLFLPLLLFSAYLTTIKPHTLRISFSWSLQLATILRFTASPSVPYDTKRKKVGTCLLSLWFRGRWQTSRNMLKKDDYHSTCHCSLMGRQKFIDLSLVIPSLTRSTQSYPP